MANVIPWGEWNPDNNNYKGSHSQRLENVFPRGDGYGPIGSFAGMTQALAGTCRGFFTSLNNDGTISVFAGSATELYKLTNTTFAWDNVSRSTYTTTPAANQWQFAQFGTTIIATNLADNVQSYVVGSSTDFADLGGSPPKAAYVTIVNEFVVLSGLSSAPYQIWWSSRSNATEWIPATNEGDQQDFVDGGLVRGVAGGEFGLVFQDNAIRRMTYSPGSAVIFEFDRISDDMGLFAPYSIIRTRDQIFFLSQKGFMSYTTAAGFDPIGKEKFDRFFFDDCDLNQKQLIIGAADPKTTRVMWAYKSAASGVNLIDRILVYDWQLKRASLITGLADEYIALAGNPGITLDGLDSVSGSIDALTTSLDDFPAGFGLKLSVADSTHTIGFFEGTNMEAVLEGPYYASDSRFFVRGQRPITDAATVFGSTSTVDKDADIPSFGTETQMNRYGLCPHRADTRAAKFRNRIPAATQWTNSMGVEPDLAKTGNR